jgi:hypothetical protein
MKSKLLVLALGCGMLLPAIAAERRSAEHGVGKAVAFERQKEHAAARQARLERRRGKQDRQQADRSADRSAERVEGREVADPGESGYQWSQARQRRSR